MGIVHNMTAVVRKLIVWLFEMCKKQSWVVQGFLVWFLWGCFFCLVRSAETFYEQ